MSALAALVKHTHCFIGTSELHLQKVRLLMATLGTDSHGSIDIFPSRSSTKNIIHLFALRTMSLSCHTLGNVARVGTRGAVKLGRRSTASGKTNLKECAVQWTEPHGV